MATMRSRCRRYFHPVVSSSFSFFSRLISVVAEWMSSCLPYFYTWCGLSTNLECRSEMCCTQLAVSSDVQEIQDAKMTQKIAICGPLHNFVRLYVRNEGVYRQSEKKLVKQQYLLHTSPQYGELQPTSG